MKVKILDEKVSIRLTMDASSPIVEELKRDSEIELGQMKVLGNDRWVEVMDGKFIKGYIAGQTRVYAIKKMIVDQDEAIVYDMPAPAAVEKSRYIKGTIFYKIDEKTEAEQGWIGVRDENGNTGWIKKETQIKEGDGMPAPAPAAVPNVVTTSTIPPGYPLPQAPIPPEVRAKNRRSEALRNMGIGAAMFFGGLIITLVSCNSAMDSGGYYFLCWGPVIYGAGLFIQGLSNLGKHD
jgi:hypothetical protein